MHISFDFAQQIHQPFYSQQVGPIYFLTVIHFSIAVEPLGQSVFCVIPEACVTLSLLQPLLSKFWRG